MRKKLKDKEAYKHSRFEKIQDGRNEICSDCGVLLCWMCHKGIPGLEEEKPTQRIVCSSYCHKEMRVHYI